MRLNVPSLLDRAIECRDSTTLYGYVEDRETAHRQAVDAQASALDTKALATALASIRSLERSPFSQLKGAPESESEPSRRELDASSCRPMRRDLNLRPRRRPEEISDGHEHRAKPEEHQPTR
jgi:hypothetical protein